MACRRVSRVSGQKRFSRCLISAPLSRHAAPAMARSPRISHAAPPSPAGNFCRRRRYRAFLAFSALGGER